MKTTILGILTILGAIISGSTQLLKNGQIDLISLIPAITAGVGLIKAQDQK
jgi:hypothetical protein